MSMHVKHVTDTLTDEVKHTDTSDMLAGISAIRLGVKYNMYYFAETEHKFVKGCFPHKQNFLILEQNLKRASFLN